MQIGNKKIPQAGKEAAMDNRGTPDCNNGRTSSEEFEELLKKIGEETFWGTNNLDGEAVHETLMSYMKSGMRKPCQSNVSEVQKALKIMGHDIHMMEKPYLTQGDNCKPQKKERSR